MKKFFILLTALTVSAPIFAQDTEVEVDVQTSPSASVSSASSVKSKRGEEVLPKAGDVGLGISATPFLQYVGRLFTGGNNAPTFGNAAHPINNTNLPFLGGFAAPGNAIWYKRMIDDNTAHRVRLQFDFSKTRQRFTTAANNPTPDPLNPTFVEEKTITKNASVLLGLGMEKRRGSTRLQGVYGAELLVGFYNQNTVNEYGNAISVEFDNPATNLPQPVIAPFGAANARVLENDPGKTFFLGARLFAGVEYFFLPKMSLGGEIGYTAGIARTGMSSTTYEYFDTATQTVQERTIESRNGTIDGYGIGLDNIGANINLFFYF